MKINRQTAWKLLPLTSLTLLVMIDALSLLAFTEVSIVKKRSIVYSRPEWHCLAQCLGRLRAY